MHVWKGCKPVAVRLHPHAVERLTERGATRAEVVATIVQGEQVPAKFGRWGFRRNFPFNQVWRGRLYSTKQILAYAVREDDWLVITVITRFF
jgi:hypothetical protein